MVHLKKFALTRTKLIFKSSSICQSPNPKLFFNVFCKENEHKDMDNAKQNMFIYVHNNHVPTYPCYSPKYICKWLSYFGNVKRKFMNIIVKMNVIKWRMSWILQVLWVPPSDPTSCNFKKNLSMMFFPHFAIFCHHQHQSILCSYHFVGVLAIFLLITCLHGIPYVILHHLKFLASLEPRSNLAQTKKKRLSQI